jgi:hypothetical protein
MRHRLTVTGVAEPRLASLGGAAGAIVNGWQISSRLVASDGFAYTATTGQDTNGDSIFNDRPAGQSRNAFVLPGYLTFDLRLSRFFPLGGGRRLELIGEGFNMTNRLNPTNVNRVWGPNPTANANFGQVTTAEAARQFQVALRLNF